LHLLLRPYETVDVRGVPVRRVRAVRELATGRELRFRTRTGIVDGLLPDPDGTLTITVPEDVLGEHATVLAVELAERV
jgi:alpha-L-fucosidase